MSRILIPEYLLNFARDIYEGSLPSNFGEILIEAKYVQVLENWYKFFGGKIPSNQDKRMVPNYLLLFIQNLANADILEVVDDDVAYIKETPQNALKYAAINKVGGMNYKVLDEETQKYVIQNSLVTSVNDTNLTANEDKYGWGINENIYNYRDYDENKGYIKVGRIDLGTLVWDLNKTTGYFRATGIPNMKLGNDNIESPSLCVPYSPSSYNTLINKDKVLAIGDNNYIYVKDTEYDNTYDLKASLNGVYLYYELAIEVVEDIASIDNIIDVSNNLTFNNEYEQAVPSEITYYVRS